MPRDSTGPGRPAQADCYDIASWGREHGGFQRTLLNATSSLVTEVVVTIRAPLLEIGPGAQGSSMVSLLLPWQ